MKKRKGFTLIELIIVVVIIGILALIAIPRYFANVEKAQKTQVFANLHAIREAMLAYYAVNGAYPASGAWPITVSLDGDIVKNISNPSSSKWQYITFSGRASPCPATETAATWANEVPAGAASWHQVCIPSGQEFSGEY